MGQFSLEALMRRALNGNGMPFVITGDGDTVVFDAAALDPNYVYAVTLFAWFNDGLANTNAIFVDEAGANAKLVAFYVGGASLELTKAAAQGSGKLIDRLLVRGNQRVVFQTAGFDSTQWLFGYFERAGVAPVKQDYRPLQPSNQLVSPYDAPIASANIAANGPPVTQVLHKLEGQQFHTDVLDIDVLAMTKAVAPGTGRVFIDLPGGVSLEIVPGDSSTVGGIPLKIFDGIPMFPTGNTNADTDIVFRAVADDAAILYAAGYGRFTRQ